VAILKVARMGHPILRQVSQPVPEEELGSPGLLGLVRDLVDTMREYDGAGLAAPQVHVPRRVVVMELASNPRYPDADPLPLTVLVNPGIEVISERRIEVLEGCLSIPGIRGVVPRAAEILVRARDPHGGVFEARYAGFHAAVVQHECDHLDGVLFVDRVADTRTLGFVRELERFGPERAGGPAAPAGDL